MGVFLASHSGLGLVLQLPWLGWVYGGGVGRLFHSASITANWFAFILNVVVVSLYLGARSHHASSSGRQRLLRAGPTAGGAR